ncbi:MAG: flagellar biosynthetic protein FliQ, partial [Simkania sp.]|nr:flagellar biosynthetic protein FliQ [Simkania sp.]
MYQSEIYQLSYQALLLILILSGPPIIISMTLGLFVAIFQAATQIQEQTLSFTVKLVAVIMTLILMG